MCNNFFAEAVEGLPLAFVYQGEIPLRRCYTFAVQVHFFLDFCPAM